MNALRHPRVSRRSGFTLLEAAICSLLVGLVFVGALRCVGATITGRMDNVDRARAMLLAQHLASEIHTQAYTEPSGSWWFGTDSGESTNNRMTLDDVDDYAGLSETPPKNMLGTTAKNGDGWTRSVQVWYVDRDDPDAFTIFDQGVKRIVVTVSRDGQTLAQLVTLKCDL